MITAKLCVVTERVVDIDVSVDQEDRLKLSQSHDVVWIGLDDAHELIAALTEVVERHKAATRITKEPAK